MIRITSVKSEKTMFLERKNLMNISSCNALSEKASTLFSHFLKNFPPDNKRTALCEKKEGSLFTVLPEELWELYSAYGTGCFGNGVIRLVDPDEYADTLYRWLGRNDSSKVPFMMTAFGDIIYYRKLSDTDDDVCLLDVHYRRTEVLAYSFPLFAKSVLASPKLMSQLLYSELYSYALLEKGCLRDNEIFCFSPALALGGRTELSAVIKAKAHEHLELLFQLGC